MVGVVDLKFCIVSSQEVISGSGIGVLLLTPFEFLNIVSSCGSQGITTATPAPNIVAGESQHFNAGFDL